MKFSEFAKILNTLEVTHSRNEITVILADFLKHLNPGEAKVAMYLIEGSLLPKYAGLEFSFSTKMIIKSLSKIAPLETIEALYSQLGDIGSTAEQLKLEFTDSLFNTEETDILHIYNNLTALALSQGKGSQEEKMNSYLDIIKKLDPLSRKYVTRIINGNLRIGLSDKTLLDVFSWYIAGDKSLRKLIETSYGYKSDIGEIAKVIIEAGDKYQEALETITLTPGTPVASKLVERESDYEAIWERMPGCFVQPKLDGLRGQIHYCKEKSVLTDKNTSIFSRNMENLTEQFPDIAADFEGKNIDSVILDSEIIGFDSTTGKYLNFQETMKRKRKYDIEEKAKLIPIVAQCFDILYLNGKDLTQTPIEERFEILQKLFIDFDFKILKQLETKKMETAEELDEYFTEKVNLGLEGIITKEPGSNYEPGTRNYKWIKLKANTKSELVDTIDVVVMGYYTGKGARSKFGVGTLLAGVYDPDQDKYFSIGKVGSGFTEANLEIMFKDLQEIKIDEIPENYVVEKPMYPNVWVSPKIVMEIVADEITRSPIHKAAINIKANVPGDDETKGLSIRFPRMKIWKRDKEYPNTVSEIVRMYELRKGK